MSPLKLKTLISEKSEKITFLHDQVDKHFQEIVDTLPFEINEDQNDALFDFLYNGSGSLDSVVRVISPTDLKLTNKKST